MAPDEPRAVAVTNDGATALETDGRKSARKRKILAALLIAVADNIDANVIGQNGFAQLSRPSLFRKVLNDQ